MDAEKITSGSWDFEFMVKKQFKKKLKNTCSNDGTPYDATWLLNKNNKRITMILYRTNSKYMIYDNYILV